MKRQVISHKSRSVGLPFQLTVLMAIVHKLWVMPEWLLGIVGLLLVIFWITSLVQLFTVEHVDIDVAKLPKLPKS